MKKIFALVLAIVMMMAIALPVFAADGESTAATKSTHVYGDSDNNPADIPNFEIKYGVAQTYTVIIPVDVDFTASLTDIERTVSVQNAILAGNERLEIAVDSTNNWILKDYESNNTELSSVGDKGVSDNVDYWFATAKNVRIAFEDDQFSETYDEDDNILVVDRAAGNKGIDGANGSVTLYFSTRGTAQEGTYKDYLTFVVDIGEYVAPQQGN